MKKRKLVAATILLFIWSILLFFHNAMEKENYMTGMGTVILFLVSLNGDFRKKCIDPAVKRTRYILPAALLIFVLFYVFASCKNSVHSMTSSDSLSNQTIPPPSSNSDATNPSLADTAYSKRDTVIHKDSSGLHK